MGLAPTSFRRFAIPLLKLLVLALVIWGGHRTIAAGLDDLHRNGWQLNQVQPGWVALAGVLYLLSQFPSGWFWHGVLTALGQVISPPRTLRAYYIGHLGKYFPGKALVVAMRAAMVTQQKLKISLAIVAVFYETFTTMAVGSVVAAIILLFTHREQTWLIIGALALAAVVALPTLPPVFVRLMRLMRMFPATAKTNATEGNSDEANATPASTAATTAAVSAVSTTLIHSQANLLLRGWLIIAIGWFFSGASLWAVLKAIGVNNLNFFTDLPLDTATVALAVVLGFVSMLPAGVGVREVVLLQLLAPRLEQLMPQQGQSLALVAVILLRLVWLVAEGILAAVLFPLARSTKPTSP